VPRRGRSVDARGVDVIIVGIKINSVDVGYLKQLSSVTTGAHPLQMVDVWCFQVEMETFM
jgi:hypothetical protein